MPEIFGEFWSLWQHLENKEDNWNKTELKTESIRKLNNFYFQWTKTLYQNNFIVHSFLHFSKAINKCHKLYEITPKNRLLWEPKKTNFKSVKFHKMKSYSWRFYLCFLNSLKFIALEKCKKRMQYGLKYSCTRFLSTENYSISW